MTKPLPDALPDLDAFDTVIDVRSPAEFAEDHVPGAINLPALSNEERARVGTVYVQQSPFLARKIGAALVARNVAAHIETALMDKPGSWQPLVYCWRGGQRSGSVATILKQIGWRAETLPGGYRTWRRQVARALHDAALPHRVVLIDGYTGTAKTDILARLSARGAQVIDLEGLAHHRGSLLGGRPGGQPSQKTFEGRVWLALQRCDPARPVLVEAESSKIGDLLVPPSLWELMKVAPRIVIEAPTEARAAYLTRSYADLVEDRAALADRITALRRLCGADTTERWLAMLDAGAFEALAADLMTRHYDPAYARSRRKETRPLLGTVRAERLDDAALDCVTAEIAQILEAAET